MLCRLVSLGVLWLTLPCLATADGPGDNLPDKVRRIPPPGVMIPEADRQELTTGVKELEKGINELKKSLTKSPQADLIPDVEIYHKAVDWAVRYDEFFDLKEVAAAKNLLKQGNERLAALRKGESPWVKQAGLVARGYRSRIDGSVQPYGVFVPSSFKPGETRKYRLDFWCHGRNEKLSELNFITGVQRSGTEFQPQDHFLIQLYGRYCCANKFAGEIDCFEVLEHAKKYYPIDDNRLVMRGFSMGGAAAWQFAVHYTDRWCAAAPGAGFSETADFLKVFQNEPVKPTWYEQKLWRWYDCTEYAANLANLPTVAYSGADDKQKQAADMMAAAMKKEGLELLHIIGPKTGHKYEPEAKKKINAFVDAAAEKGRDPMPKKVTLVTHTLRYNRMYWVEILGLEKHWEPARVEAEFDGETIRAKTSGVTELWLFPGGKPKSVAIDGQILPAEASFDTRDGLQRGAHLWKEGDKWVTATRQHPPLTKRPGLQGPIDDAFMSSFIFVKPTGKPLNEAVGKWVESEYNHAVDHWRRQFRGIPRTREDSKITDGEIKGNNLILFGDPSSNAILAKIAAKLPIRWNDENVRVGELNYPAGTHVPVLIYPNPLNPRRYVVLNSGFTFREYDYLNNARQIPKLPDFALIDITSPITSRAPGKIVTAGFFGERWELPAK